ncbi:UNKNOWN [Stylonychia lemnae]|uniref:Uncharacterized protein n=1 Tax=Stylonychia lemnae TaxID=5949 RepID=A0A078AFB6_STYLE|nr:UNKNOWN [Stylonychia lemnae]|eukprot:CDW80934.1 UNKNOWN [Stylonychia lemnae]
MKPRVCRTQIFTKVQIKLMTRQNHLKQKAESKQKSEKRKEESVYGIIYTCQERSNSISSEIQTP